MKEITKFASCFLTFPKIFVITQPKQFEQQLSKELNGKVLDYERQLTVSDNIRKTKPVLRNKEKIIFSL